jgi:hypothetical protein
VWRRRRRRDEVEPPPLDHETVNGTILLLMEIKEKLDLLLEKDENDDGRD